MSTAFDPYRKWLGIPVAEQPPNHYRLLAIGLFEDDPDVIETAADQRMSLLRTFQAGPHSMLSQKLLNELAKAKLCLLNPEKKAAYDAELRSSMAASHPMQPVVAVTASPAGTVLVQRIPPARPSIVPIVVGQVFSPEPRFEPPPLIVKNSRNESSEAGTGRSRLLRAAVVWTALAAVAIPAAIFIGRLVWIKPGPASKPKRAGPLANQRFQQNERSSKPAALYAAPLSFGLRAELFRDKELKHLVKTRVDPQIDWMWAFAAPDDDVPADGFSVRWTGWLKPPRPGPYKFALIGDDGIRLWVSEKLLIDLWGNHLPERQEATIVLTRDPVGIRVEHYDDIISSLASLRWTPPGNSHEEPVPAEVLFQDQESAKKAVVRAARPDFSPASGTGLRAEIYRGANFQAKLLSRVDPDVNWAWGQDAPAQNAPADGFSIRWTGWLKPPEPGEYRLIFIGDDGVRLWIDDRLVIDDWHDHDPTRLETTVNLSARHVRIRLEYFDSRLSAVASLRWIPPKSTIEQVVPREYLFQDEP